MNEEKGHDVTRYRIRKTQTARYAPRIGVVCARATLGFSYNGGSVIRDHLRRAPQREFRDMRRRRIRATLAFTRSAIEIKHSRQQPDRDTCGMSRPVLS